MPEMHQALLACGISIAERSMTHLMPRDEELIALRVADQERLRARFQKTGPRQPGHRWVTARCRPGGALDRPRLPLGGDLPEARTEAGEGRPPFPQLPLQRFRQPGSTLGKPMDAPARTASQKVAQVGQTGVLRCATD